MERPKKQATLCIIANRDDRRILLAMKKRGFGVGKWNGYGGKVNACESVLGAAVRELEEESGLRLTEGDLKKVGEFDFYFPHKPEFNQTVHVYLIEEIDGEPIESEEMLPKWFSFSEIPYHNKQMWDDDKYWLPQVLEGKKLRASFTFKKVDDENIVDKQDISEVDSL